jgi:hypothetical protein
LLELIGLELHEIIDLALYYPIRALPAQAQAVTQLVGQVERRNPRGDPQRRAALGDHLGVTT